MYPLTLILILTSMLAGTGEQHQVTPIAHGQQWVFPSKHLGDTRVQLYVPKSHDLTHEERTYPLVVVFGSQFFQITAAVVDHLGKEDRMPEALIISFPETRLHAPDVYTNGMWGPSPERLEFGADPQKFANFFQDELLPYLKQHYRLADYRIAIGASAGALPLFHAFLHNPGLFHEHITLACADMLGMGYEQGKTFIDAFEQHLKQKPNRVAGLYVFTSDNDAPTGSEDRRHFEAFDQRLSALSNQKLRATLLPNEGHYASWLPALTKSLSYIFPPDIWSPDHRPFDKHEGKVLATIDAHYQMLSDRYGFTILPRGDRWNSGDCLRGTGRRLMNKDRAKEAAELFTRWCAYRPTSSYAREELARAYVALGEKTKARTALNEALKLAETHEPQEASRLRQKMKDLNL